MARKLFTMKEKKPMPIDVRVRELMEKKFGSDDSTWPSQVEIAKELGVQPATVASWLKKRVDRAELDTLDKWCEYFNVEVGEILVRIPKEKR